MIPDTALAAHWQAYYSHGWPLVHALVVTGAVMGAIAFAMAVLQLTRLGRSSFWQWHHAYIGLALCVVPQLGGGWLIVSVLAWAIGVMCVIDDAVQHSLQVDDPTYLSPIHRLYQAAFAFFRRHPALAWIDTIFGALGGA